MKASIPSWVLALAVWPLGCGDDTDAPRDTRDDDAADTADAIDDVEANDAAPDDDAVPDALEDITDTAPPEVTEPCGGPCGDHASCIDEECVCDPGALASGGACVPPVGIGAFRVAPQTIFALAPIEAIFEVSEARSCRLESELFAAPREMDAESLESGRYFFSVSREELAATSDRGGYVPVVLHCDGAGEPGDNVAAAALYVRAALGPGIVLTPSETVLPAEGGTIDLCWQAHGAAFCAVFGPDLAREELGPSGCVEGLVVPPGAVSDFSVMCGDGLDDGVGNVVQETIKVVAGTGIRAFEANPSILGQAGRVHVTWEAGGVDGCGVFAGADRIGEGASGALDLVVAAETELTLRCTAGESELVETRIVSVGAAVLGFGGGFRGGDVTWSAIAESCSLAIANDTFSVVIDDLPTTGKDAQMPLPVPTETRADGYAMTLTCTRGDFIATRTLTVLPEPAIDALTFDPPGLVATPGEVDVCWRAAHADSCWLYLQGSGDGWGPFPTEHCESLEVLDWMFVRLECYADSGAATVSEREVPIGNFGVLTATPVALAAPGRATLSWQTGGVEQCILLRDEAFLAEVPTTGTLEVEVAADASFLLRCAHGGGIFDYPTSIKVGVGIDTFTVTPVGAGAAVSWSTRQVDGCALTVDDGRTLDFEGLPAQQAVGTIGGGGVKPPKDPNKGPRPGFAVPYDRSQAATFTLTCSGPGGKFVRVVEVPAAVPVEMLSLTVTPAMLPLEGANIDVCITSIGAEVCTMSLVSLETGVGRALAMPVGPNPFRSGNGCTATSGFPELFVDETSELTVTCEGFESSAERRIVVSDGRPVASLAADPPALAAPGSVTLSWSSLFAASCELARDGEILAEGLANQALAIAIAQTSTFTLTCGDEAGRTVVRTLRVPVGADLTVDAEATGPSQLRVHVASVAITGCLVVATNGDTTMGTGHDFEREEAPVNGEVYFDWQFEYLGRADVTVTCRDSSGATHERVTFVDPPESPVITSFAVPEGFLSAGSGDICFTSTGAAWCDLSVDGYGGFTFPTGQGCWSDDGRGPVAFTQTLGVGLSCYSAIGMPASRYTLVPVGPAILSLDIDRPLLEEPGEVTVSWRTFGMSACTLFNGDAVVDARTSGEASVALDANADFLLSCVDGAGVTHERELHLLVGRQIAWLQARAWDGATIGVEWRALFVDRCAVRVTSAAGIERAYATDLPTEAGLGYEWSFAADGAAHVELVCESDDGSDDLVRTAVISAPVAPAIASLVALPGALDAPGEADICWTTTGTVNGCHLQVTGRAPSTLFAVFDDGPSGCASTSPGFGRLLALDATSDVSLQCYGPLGQLSAALLVPVGPDITLLRAEPSWLDAPGRTTISWAAHAVTGCALSNASGDVLASGASGALDLALDASTALTLTCATPRGEVSRGLGVGVGPALFIEEAIPVAADVILVAWRAERSDACTMLISGGDVPGQLLYLPPVGRERFWHPFASVGDAHVEITCDVPTSVSASADVASPTPAVTAFTVDPIALAAPGLAALCWTSERTERCELTVGGDVTTDLASEDCLDVEVGLPVDASLRCTSIFGEASAALSIPVGPTITELSPSVAQVPPGGYFVTLTWDSVLTTACTLADEAGAIATGVSGAERLFVSAETTFTLTCDAGPKQLTRTVVVTVAPR